MHCGVFRESYSLPLHKSLLTRDQQSFPNIFSNGNVTNQQWDIFSYNYPRILSALRDWDGNYFTYHCKLCWKKSWHWPKIMFESEYKRSLCDSLIQSSAGRVQNFRNIGVDIPRLIEWAGGENFSKYQSFGSDLFTYRPSAEKCSVWFKKAKNN